MNNLQIVPRPDEDCAVPPQAVSAPARHPADAPTPGLLLVMAEGKRSEAEIVFLIESGVGSEYWLP